MAMPERLLVLGGDAGGMAAATQVRRRRPDMEIVAVERGRHTSYSACGIPYLVGGDVDGADDLVARTPETFREQGIDVRTRVEAVGIDLDRREVEVRLVDEERSERIGFDVLHLGLGATPLRPPILGIDGPRVFGVQTLDDATRLLDRAGDAARVVVVGAGYIGIEMAEAFVRRGARVTVVEQAAQPMGTLDPDMGALVADAMRRVGIDVRLGEAVVGIEDDAVTTEAGVLPSDAVVLGLGVLPNARLAAEAGIEVGVKGAVRVDRHQRTSTDGVWAAGDCCESFHLVSQRSVHVALGTVANKQARVAGINIGGGDATFPGVVGTAVSKLCGTEVGRTGLHQREAEAAGFDAVAATIESTTRAGYYPDAGPITVRLIAERGTGRLLGGQIVGAEGAAKRVDVLATALTAGMTVHQLIDLDLAYAPPFSPVWDPLLVAARTAADLVAE